MTTAAWCLFGFTPSLYAVSQQASLPASTLRESLLLPSPDLIRPGVPFLRLQRPFRVSPVPAANVFAAILTTRTFAPFRGSFPFDVFPATRSHLPPTNPNPPVPLHPQGFTPSRCFAPLTAYWAYFIPVPSMGFSLRGFAPPGSAVRPFERRSPS